jgi:Lrp/AsnC family transcriptional regulator, leucine-responsive regulatory protein
MEYKIDLKDKKILYELDKNSRQSASQIAKKIKLSKNSVINRIKQMQTAGIIKGFHALIDSGKLGYISFRLYINLMNASINKEKEILEFLRKNSIITWLASSDGKYNIVAVGITKSIYDINALWDQLLQKYVNYFGERLITINIRSTHFSRAYLIHGEKNIHELLTAASSSQISLDKTDKELIHILSENARMPIIEIARKLRLTEKTIISRIKSLEKQGIIVAYRTIFDREKIGYQYFKVSFILVRLTPKRANQLQEYVRNHSNVICREETLGGDDFEVDLEVMNISELREIIADMREKFGDIILDYQILHIYKEHKDLFFHP